MYGQIFVPGDVEKYDHVAYSRTVLSYSKPFSARVCIDTAEYSKYGARKPVMSRSGMAPSLDSDILAPSISPVHLVAPVE